MWTARLHILAYYLVTFVSGELEGSIDLSFDPSEVTLQSGRDKNVTISFSSPLQSPTLLIFEYQEGKSPAAYEQGKRQIIEPLPNITAPQNETSVSLTLEAQQIGTVFVSVNSSSMELSNLSDSYLKVSVVHSAPLVIINAVIGWIYFAAWSISFYPQIIYNWQRKSVIGLNFDFLAYNLTGFIAYGMFNVGMYWIDEVKAEYHEKYPRGVNPVQLNDVFFTLHAVAVTAFTILQCFIFERGGQRVSRLCIVLLSAAWLTMGIALFVALGHKITWLTYLYYFSYVKLGVTLIKYIPQALMNYRRKSTQGWSIGNVLLDFTGGSFSLLQMFLISYNNNDWSSIFGDPTKFGLGFFSVLFDIFFMVQHYCLYKGNNPYDPIILDVD